LPISSKASPRLRAAETIGQPLGSERFLDAIARLTGRDARAEEAKKRGI
jgi:hypothetical protein